MDGAFDHLVARAFLKMADRTVGDDIRADIGDGAAVDADNVVVRGAVDVEPGSVFARDGGETVLRHQRVEGAVDRRKRHIGELKPNLLEHIGCGGMGAA